MTPAAAIIPPLLIVMTPRSSHMLADKQNVVSLNAHVGDKFFLPAHVKIENKTAENKLIDLAKKHPEFDLEHFASGVSDAFAIVVESFAEGDKETLQDLLAEPVYEAFERAIDERDERGEKVVTQIQAVKKAEITKADLQDNMLYLTVKFTAKEICVIRDKDDNIISGDPEKATQMTDIWIFGRALDSDAPEWLVYETIDDVPEDHKTPMPESSSKSSKSKKSKPDPEQ